MKPSYEALKNALKEKGVGLSHQRLKVLEYLSDHPTHPTADEVYSELKQNIPTLSKTTVYNTLKVLVESGLVRTLGIEGHQARYDLKDIEHGHFKCLGCGQIFDVPMDVDSLMPGFLSSWEVRETEVHFKGHCPECASNK